jgi:hypothetical protein
MKSEAQKSIVHNYSSMTPLHSAANLMCVRIGYGLKYAHVRCSK